MFPNLEAEMARKKITQAKLAERLGITPTTLSFKLNGKSSLSLKSRTLASYVQALNGLLTAQKLYKEKDIDE